MARKTREEAEHTRQQVVDAARQVFALRGVSRTTMEHIAAQAGVTRGAIYWHFANKSELFQAMREQVHLPFADRMDDTLLAQDIADPLSGIEDFLLQSLDSLETEEATRQILEIMMLKCEYVDEFAGVLLQMNERCDDLVTKLRVAYERAQERGLLRPGLVPAMLAVDTYCFFAGVTKLWLGDTAGVVVRDKLQALIATHVDTRRA